MALNLARWILPGPFHQVPVPGRRGAQRDVARPPRARRTVSIGRHNRHRREPPESRAVSSAGRMVSSLFRSDKSGNPAYILVEKVRDPDPDPLRPETDGTPLPGERCIIPFGSRPLSAGFWGFQSRRERPIASVGCIGRVRVVPRGPLGVVASPNPRVPGPDLTQKKGCHRRVEHVTGRPIVRARS